MQLALVFSCLLVLGHCIQEQSQKNQGILFTDDLNKELIKTPLGRSILRLASLKSKTQQVDFSRLFTAIDDLVDSLKERKTEENALFEQDYQQYLSDHDFYQVQVTQFTEEVAQHEVALNDLLQSRGESEGSLRAKNQELANSQREQKNLRNTMQRDQTQVEAKLREYDQAIEVVDRVTGLIQQVNNNETGRPRFIEITQDDIKGAAILFQKTMDTVSHDKPFYEPIVEVLMEIGTNQNFSNQRAVRTVIDLLGKLRREIVENRNALQGQSQLEREAQQAISNGYDQFIQEVSEVIANLQADIEVKNGQVETKNGLLRDAQENLNTAQDNFDVTEARWTARQAQHKTLIESFDAELLILSQTVQALERGGIRRQ